VSTSAPVGPYSPIVRAGDLVVCSGQLGLAAGKLVQGGVHAEVTQAIENVADLLATEGGSLADLVKTTVFLTNMGEFETMNAAYVAALGQHRPARTAVAVRALPLGASVEVEAWAYLPRR